MQPPFYLFHFVIFATHPDDVDIIRALVSAGSSCHNSAASFYSCAAGCPPKSLGGREKVSLFPHIVIASKMPPLGYRLTLIAQNSCVSPPQAVYLRGVPASLVYELCTDNAVYSLVKLREGKYPFTHFLADGTVLVYAYHMFSKKNFNF